MAKEQSAVVRTKHYIQKANLKIRAVGTDKFYLPPQRQGAEPSVSYNVGRLTFKPGAISVCQRLHNGLSAFMRLESDLYLWNATFKIADLRNIRVREDFYSDKTRVDLLAVCTAPPIGHGLVAKAGTDVREMYEVAVGTSEPTASRVAIANLSDRWASGDQEIQLTFYRSKQPQYNVQGKLWVWDAFLAFLCGREWSTPTFDTFRSHAYRPLAEIVNSKSLNPYAEFEKEKNGWVLIKM